jgi:hypothetical protein
MRVSAQQRLNPGGMPILRNFGTAARGLDARSCSQIFGNFAGGGAMPGSSTFLKYSRSRDRWRQQRIVGAPFSSRIGGVTLALGSRPSAAVQCLFDFNPL